MTSGIIEIGSGAKKAYRRHTKFSLDRFIRNIFLEETMSKMKSKEQGLIGDNEQESCLRKRKKKKVVLGEQGVGIWRKGSIPDGKKYVHGPVSER